MVAKWGSCVILAICLAVLAGCRTPQPNLKPEKTPEQLVSPPTGGRYDVAGLPKEAYDKMEDPNARAMDMKNGVMPSRGSAVGAGPGGMPGR
jgi:hypothetical protein